MFTHTIYKDLRCFYIEKVNQVLQTSLTNNIVLNNDVFLIVQLIILRPYQNKCLHYCLCLFQKESIRTKIDCQVSHLTLNYTFEYLTFSLKIQPTNEDIIDM